MMRLSTIRLASPISWRPEASKMKVGGGRFLSSHDPCMVLSIGTRTKIDWLEVHWSQPGGAKKKLNLPIDRYITIVEGESIKGL
jgi:enediyne biosynthesis protein E4